MKILVVGGGGREHAIWWKTSKEKNVGKAYCAPGNAGITNVAECVNIGDTKIVEVLKFAKEEGIGKTIAGPEVPIAMVV
ncbi:phosphoribosylamine--glycine ligase, partial [Clostridioides difficile]